jgi:hypothetical protein
MRAPKHQAKRQITNMPSRLRRSSLLAFVSILASCALACTGSNEHSANTDESARTQTMTLPTDLSAEQWQQVDAEVARLRADAQAALTAPGISPIKDADCVKRCQQTYDGRVRMYLAIYESHGSAHYHDLNWLNQVLAGAKSDFDACLAACQ